MIRALQLDDVPACAALLVARHAEHRSTQPLLAPLDAEGAVAAITALVEGGRGAVSVVGGEIAGYLVGTTKAGASWGANSWVEPAGCAGRDLPELWAFLARDWVAEGLTAFYALVPPSYASVFFGLGFGLQHVHAVKPAVAGPPDPRVRPAVRADIPVLARLDGVLDEHLVSSPVFSAAPVTPYAEAVADWEESFDEFATWVAEVDGEVVGSAVGCDIAKSSSNTGLIAPARAALLGFAAVLPSARGLGLGRALEGAVVSWAASEGYPVVCTDWRATNLEAARTWPALGYAQTFLRLHRLVGR